jgi:poly-gamma-glutamate synthesis protein (capsule biosynthesis protein)
MTRILVAGDFACFDRTLPLILSGKHEEVLGEVRAYTGQSDYAIVNFEAPVVLDKATPVAKTGPNVKVPPQAVEAIKHAGFNAVTLAHNHIYDYGEQGVEDTIVTLNKESIEYLGAGKNITMARAIKYKTIRDKRFAFLNFCEAEWSIATGRQGGANPLNPVTNYHDIREARAKADHVIVIVHGGHELYQLPSPRMKETYRFFIDAGADAVINSHQHCFSGHEVYNGKPVFYGLGNFLFDFLEDRDTIWNYGYMVVLTFDDAGISFEQIPYKQCGDTPSVKILEDRTGFDKKITGLNAIIQDDEKLQAAFEQMAASRTSLLSLFEPYNDRYSCALASRGLLPRFFNAQKRRVLLNRVRCQSHRDVLLQLLKKNS